MATRTCCALHQAQDIAQRWRIGVWWCYAAEFLVLAPTRATKVMHDALMDGAWDAGLA